MLLTTFAVAVLLSVASNPALCRRIVGARVGDGTVERNCVVCRRRLIVAPSQSSAESLLLALYFLAEYARCRLTDPIDDGVQVRRRSRLLYPCVC